MSLHPFDQSIQLSVLDEGVYRGRMTAAYANMIGPFGGIIAAAVLNSILHHPQRLGEPIALTVNFAGPIADADFEIRTHVARRNRSTQHWTVELTQNGDIAVTGSAWFAERRETWSSQELPFPAVPPEEAVPPIKTDGFPAWMKNYQMRFIEGRLTLQAEDAADSSLSRLWVRDEPPRPIDFLSLTAMADVFFPRIFLRTQVVCPAGTVSMTIYYHADGRQLQQHGPQALLASARSQQLRNGFADQLAELWTADGTLLATSQQLVYFKL